MTLDEFVWCASGTLGEPQQLLDFQTHYKTRQWAPAPAPMPDRLMDEWLRLFEAWKQPTWSVPTWSMLTLPLIPQNYINEQYQLGPKYVYLGEEWDEVKLREERERGNHFRQNDYTRKMNELLKKQLFNLPIFKNPKKDYDGA